jgi:hypothetical protein
MANQRLSFVRQGIEPFPKLGASETRAERDERKDPQKILSWWLVCGVARVETS